MKSSEARGAEVFIAVAGKAAHLAGVVAAHTVRPVIGVPVESEALAGMDALLSTVQMPKGVPGGDHGPGQARRHERRPSRDRDPGPQRRRARKEAPAYRAKMADKVEAGSAKLKEKL